MTRVKSVLPWITLIIGQFVLCLSSLTPGAARANDSIAEFRQFYPTAADRLQTAYSHVTITGRRVAQTDQSRLVEDVEFMRSGDMLRQRITKVSGYPVSGAVEATGGSAEKYFIIEKETAANDFRIVSFGSRTGLIERARISYQPLFVPFSAYDIDIKQYLQTPSTKIISVKPSQLDGVDAIEVITSEATQDGPKRYQFWFLPQSFAAIGFRLALNGEKFPHQAWIEGRAGYDVSNPPKLKLVEYWTDRAAVPGKKFDLQRFEISAVEFGEIAADQFTLAAFGVEEPAPTRQSSTYLWFLIGSAVIFLALGLLFRVLHRRRV